MKRPFPITQIIVHHADISLKKTSEQFTKIIDENHKRRLHPTKNGFGNHIAYHMLITKDGNVKETRPLDEVGYHAGNWAVNLRSIGICLQGKFEEEEPTEKQLNALQRLITELMGAYSIKHQSVRLHRDIKPTACPGKNLADKHEWFKYGQWDRKVYERRLMSEGIVTVPKNMDETPNREEVTALVAKAYDKLLVKLEILEDENKELRKLLSKKP